MSDMQEMVDRAESEGSDDGKQLSQLARSGMGHLQTIYDTTDFTDRRDRRLIVDVALGAIRAAIRVDEAQMRGRQADRIGEVLERIAAVRQKRLTED